MNVNAKFATRNYSDRVILVLTILFINGFYSCQYNSSSLTDTTICSPYFKYGYTDKGILSARRVHKSLPTS